MLTRFFRTIGLFIYYICHNIQHHNITTSDLAIDALHQRPHCLIGRDSLYCVSKRILDCSITVDKMGTLTDITAKANNAIKRQSADIMGSQTLKTPTPSGPLGKSKSPHFMSPTVSSSKQSIPASKTVQGRVSTPSSLSSGKGNGWMASAAKRVGINRSGDGTPRSRKEDLLKISKSPSALAFPDKVRNLCFLPLHSLARIDSNSATSLLHLLTLSFQVLHLRIQLKL